MSVKLSLDYTLRLNRLTRPNAKKRSVKIGEAFVNNVCKRPSFDQKLVLLAFHHMS